MNRRAAYLRRVEVKWLFDITIEIISYAVHASTFQSIYRLLAQHKNHAIVVINKSILESQLACSMLAGRAKTTARRAPGTPGELGRRASLTIKYRLPDGEGAAQQSAELVSVRAGRRHGQQIARRSSRWLAASGVNATKAVQRWKRRQKFVACRRADIRRRVFSFIIILHLNKDDGGR